MPQKQQRLLMKRAGLPKGLTIGEISANLTFSKRSLCTTNDCVAGKKYLQVRLGGGIRGPGPRANVGLEESGFERSRFFFVFWYGATRLAGTGDYLGGRILQRTQTS